MLKGSQHQNETVLDKLVGILTINQFQQQDNQLMVHTLYVNSQ